jgi:apolipoprotein D and lipocalin family protein
MRAAYLMLPLLFLGWTKTPPAPSVPELDVERYMGTWYEIQSIPQWFQRGCHGTEAHYALREDGTFSVRNTCWIGPQTDRLKEANGKGWQPNPKEPGRLKIQFFWPFSGDLWVFQLDHDYQWALVGSPKRSSLWILSRTPTLDPAIVSQLRQWAADHGFDLQKLQPSPQRHSSS